MRSEMKISTQYRLIGIFKSDMVSTLVGSFNLEMTLEVLSMIITMVMLMTLMMRMRIM
jgi:hypothetical protein